MVASTTRTANVRDVVHMGASTTQIANALSAKHGEANTTLTARAPFVNVTKAASITQTVSARHAKPTAKPYHKVEPCATASQQLGGTAPFWILHN